MVDALAAYISMRLLLDLGMVIVYVEMEFEIFFFFLSLLFLSSYYTYAVTHITKWNLSRETNEKLVNSKAFQISENVFNMEMWCFGSYHTKKFTHFSLYMYAWRAKKIGWQICYWRSQSYVNQSNLVLCKKSYISFDRRCCWFCWF